MKNKDMMVKENVLNQLKASVKNLFLCLPQNGCTIMASPDINVISSRVSRNWSESFTQLGGNIDFYWVQGKERDQL